MAAGGGGGGRASSSSSSAAASSSSAAGALEASLDRKLQAVTNTMESIQGLSSWCLENKRHHSTIVYHWMKWLRRWSPLWAPLSAKKPSNGSCPPNSPIWGSLGRGFGAFGAIPMFQCIAGMLASPFPAFRSRDELGMRRELPVGNVKQCPMGLGALCSMEEALLGLDEL
ncbi:hypothetical protein AAES_42991 [Amazona aestiva]|uniref:CID domain-containing protein n=1 Tax=Amazona aestiva TaxID=12930 RepID=A0A0Q3RHB7_AMAAE|nr:hypothetical protein AAES_42991 [Amazona aestiva]